ncbi:MAG: plasmid partitioning protein RepB [Pseudomonadota bacterium]
MARKDLLKGLMDAAEPAKDIAVASPARPRYTKGAIGAVSRSIADLKSRSVVELDPNVIDAGGVQDRLEHDEREHATLMASLREYGQQVPVLVRPHPEVEDRFQIVYGRRRVLAMRDLGLPVKAMIRDLDDKSLVIAQGQENTARRDLSFIERANFARQMTEAGYDRKAICAALSVDKTVISRMLAVTENVPVAVIEMVGASPGIGRDRWLAFSNLWTRYEGDADTAGDLMAVSRAQTSDQRFDALYQWLKSKEETEKSLKNRKTISHRTPLRTSDGQALGTMTRSARGVTITLKTHVSQGFEDWLVNNIEALHHDWRRRQSQEG